MTSRRGRSKNELVTGMVESISRITEIWAWMVAVRTHSLLVPTRSSRWTAYFDNLHQGTDTSGLGPTHRS